MSLQKQGNKKAIALIIPQWKSIHPLNLISVLLCASYLCYNLTATIAHYYNVLWHVVFIQVFLNSSFGWFSVKWKHRWLAQWRFRLPGRYCSWLISKKVLNKTIIHSLGLFSFFPLQQIKHWYLFLTIFQGLFYYFTGSV